MTLLTFTVPGPPRGSERARTAGKRRFHSDAHMAARDAIVTAVMVARYGPGWATLITTPVRVVIETWHRRSIRESRARRCWGQLQSPFKGKPDADNVAKLVLDACTRAGVWTDDTVVAQLEVRRWWVAVGVDGQQGEERTVVRVEGL